FFRVEGIRVETNFGPTPRWMQPIINQPEIGILGFLTQRIGGVLHFLVQAKMEPGNVNMLQISPTVQATRSNYTQVHGGSRPRYLEYFLDPTRARVLVDQLQSEQGARFLRKRNRNIIVEVPEGERVEVHPDFCWLTLGQLHDLLRVDNLVNMDSRTVLSCVRYSGEWPHTRARARTPRLDSPFQEAVLASALSGEEEAVNDFDHIVSWLTDLKVRYSLSVQRVPLKEVENWERDEWEIRHVSRRFFRVIGVAVRASNREVQSWEQPLIDSREGGILCLVCQRQKGVLHFLIQGRVEPGNLDGVEMAPTLQCTPANYDPAFPERYPPFFDLVMNAPPEWIRYTSIQSEEGGRFYHDQNRYLVLEVDEGQKLDLPPNYIWMTLRQMKEFIRFNNYFNIEARGLLACLV
ncbi:MAG: NDP-hexose 2,3-dehydratase family protein, partial [Armatimonadota bacterium]|nr:NDP-hexose 2,3-dehydratase family protein [Armatimonadota bacterium]